MTPQEKAEFDRRRRQRNLVVGAVLLGFVILFYAITIVRMGD
ncbi:hypothetical protein [Aurantiacibacter luteus]|uniref:Cytochrome C oxidase assembly protein n=1 Tax=Aurantiacibacter luteus TaxID=1581420 RepID=A0A0G9MWN1_9SPHN|nr:hypothetical protein [Aurantiacibacter luteus]KLE35024.1 cytochrome C oxidase assembly protein [Aurantiacibacter luteus]